MPIMAGRGWDDARATTRLLAGTALECLQDPSKAPEWIAALENVYRLLESFRSNPTFGFASTEKPGQGRSIDAFTVTPPREKHLVDVREAIKEALKAVFADQSTEAAVQEIETVLRALAYPSKNGAPSPAARERATRFFRQVSEHLASA